MCKSRVSAERSKEKHLGIAATLETKESPNGQEVCTEIREQIEAEIESVVKFPLF